MQLEPWHIPVLAMTVVMLPVAVHWLVRSLRPDPTEQDGGKKGPVVSDPVTRRNLVRARTATLAVLALVLLGFGISAAIIVPEALNVIAALGSAISGVVSAALAVASFRGTDGGRG